jgi:hypothetical protein
VPRNSLPEMAQVDRWARGVALGELDALVPAPPPAATDLAPAPKPDAPTRARKRRKGEKNQMTLFPTDEKR